MMTMTMKEKKRRVEDGFIGRFFFVVFDSQQAKVGDLPSPSGRKKTNGQDPRANRFQRK